MVVGVPVLVEHVVAHDEPNGAVRHFEVDQHGFLMVRRGRCQGKARGATDLRIETRAPHLMFDFRSFIEVEAATDKHRQPQRALLGCFVVRDRTLGKPLSVVGILVIRGRLQRPVVDSVRAFAG